MVSKEDVTIMAVRKASYLSTQTCCVPLTVLCLCHPYTTYIFSSVLCSFKLFILPSDLFYVCVYICLVSIGVSVAICYSLVSSCHQVVQMDAALKPPDKPGSEKRDLMTLLPFSVTFFSSRSSYRQR